MHNKYVYNSVIRLKICRPTKIILGVNNNKVIIYNYI